MKESSLVVLALQLVSLAVCMLGSTASEHPLALTGSGSAADGLQRCVLLAQIYGFDITPCFPSPTVVAYCLLQSSVHITL